MPPAPRSREERPGRGEGREAPRGRPAGSSAACARFGRAGLPLVGFSAAAAERCPARGEEKLPLVPAKHPSASSPLASLARRCPAGEKRRLFVGAQLPRGLLLSLSWTCTYIVTFCSFRRDPVGRCICVPFPTAPCLCSAGSTGAVREGEDSAWFVRDWRGVCACVCVYKTA